MAPEDQSLLDSMRTIVKEVVTETIAQAIAPLAERASLQRLSALEGSQG